MLLLLTGPALSSATVVVACDIEQSAWSGWNNICLPYINNAHIQFTKGRTEVTNNLFAHILGFGDDFASAWEDAEAHCRSIATKVNSSGAHIFPADFTCPINSCEVNETSGIFRGYCKCIRDDNCSTLDDKYENRNHQSFQDIYNAGLQFCSRKAVSSQTTLTVLCGFSISSTSEGGTQ